MIDPTIPRHIMASMSHRFSQVALSLGLEYHVETVDPVEVTDFTRNYVSFRMNGPYMTVGSGVTFYAVELSILLTGLMGGKAEDKYNMFTWAGIYMEDMNGALPIYNYGDGSGDPILIGCLQPHDNIKEPIRINNFGQVDRTSGVKQMSVNGKYILTLYSN